MTPFVRTAAALALGLVSEAALAQTTEDRRACTGDVLRLCASALPHRDRVITCVLANRGRLGGACRAVVARYSEGTGVAIEAKAATAKAARDGGKAGDMQAVEAR
jgi:hypothetical protein